MLNTVLGEEGGFVFAGGGYSRWGFSFTPEIPANSTGPGDANKHFSDMLATPCGKSFTMQFKWGWQTLQNANVKFQILNGIG